MDNVYYISRLWKADPLLMKCVIFFGCFCRASGEIIEGHTYSPHLYTLYNNV